MHSLPVFVRLAGRAVMLIGEGEAADAKRRLLDRAGAIVVGEEATDAVLAIVVDNDAAVARLKARGVLVNAVDRPELCDFTLPAIVERGDVIVAVGTGGVSAGLAAALRQRLEGWLSSRLGGLARLLFDWRDDLRRAFPDPIDRRQAIARALAPGGVLDLADPNLENPFWIDDVRDGGDWTVAYVHLRSVDPDMLTLRDARQLAFAERVYYEAGVPETILNRARADAPRIAGEPPATPLAGLSVFVQIAR